MPRKVRVATLSFIYAGGTTIEENRDRACEFVEMVGSSRPDLVCLPENYLFTNLRGPARTPEPLDGPTTSALGKLARKYGTWIVGGLLTEDAEGVIRNHAVVLDRQGELAGAYAKTHPTVEECEDRKIVPGSLDPFVLETDFGRLGLAICFDIGWPAQWAGLRSAGAELVVWPSAYDGGFPLQAYAWLHQYYVVSSVRSFHSKIIDLTGEVLASTSQWHRAAVETIDLEKRVFHIDQQYLKLQDVQRDLGAGVTIRTGSQENIFTLESNDDAWPLDRIMETYGLVDLTTYLARSTEVQDKHRA
ncbi:carbon-nitrogen hydrolase family protein [Tenggerimyces flavus]|uniref:Carbon-nitrogen hydrolase family protein n=1 Tax=Tenggerimyces flavus TaxID=1708749 RepID=A0ABV7YMH1_9ACTN|nr:carbon-nitrogen hydrolase family protein [Tenggerimyces flavus]MBM7789654.1 putative amidohydrolase [Tenggerimyces flavus]